MTNLEAITQIIKYKCHTVKAGAIWAFSFFFFHFSFHISWRNTPQLKLPEAQACLIISQERVEGFSLYSIFWKSPVRGHITGKSFKVKEKEEEKWKVRLAKHQH